MACSVKTLIGNESSGGASFPNGTEWTQGKDTYNIINDIDCVYYGNNIWVAGHDKDSKGLYYFY